MTHHPTDDACSADGPGNDPHVHRPAWADRALIRPDGAEFSSSLTVALPGEGAVTRGATLQIRQRVRLAVDGEDCVRVVRDAPVLHLPEIACTQEQVITLVDAILRTISAIPFPPVAGTAPDAEGTDQGRDAT